MNQTACKRFIRASPSVRGSCPVEWLSALPTSVLDVVAEDRPEARETTVDVGLCQRMRMECTASTGMSGMHQMRPAIGSTTLGSFVRDMPARSALTLARALVLSQSRAVGKRPPRPKYPI
jgi:hypothetical protein